MEPTFDTNAKTVVEAIRSYVSAHIGSQDVLYFKLALRALLELVDVGPKLPLLLLDEAVWPSTYRDQFRNEPLGNLGFRDGIAGKPFLDFMHNVTGTAQKDGAATIGEQHIAAALVEVTEGRLRDVGLRSDVLLKKMAEVTRQSTAVADRWNEKFENIVLETEQEELLVVLVEAARNVTRDRRKEFLLGRGRGTIIHPGLPGDHNFGCYQGDIHILANMGLVNITSTSVRSDGDLRFDVTPLGFRYYEYMNRRSGRPLQQVETNVRSYLDASYQKRYPGAYQKWLEAEQLLWGSDSQRQLSTIGHHCREAMQEFATELIQRYQPPDVDPDKQKTVARVRAVLEHRRDQLGKTENAFLQALLAYWGTVGDLVQRQEHGAQREGEPLIWEDGRRVVFQTALVMFEIDRSLSR